VVLKELESLYRTYNRREFIIPDPLQFVWLYEGPADREVVGLIASSLAFGSVPQIVRSVNWVLRKTPSPALWVRGANGAAMRAVVRGFRHRFVDADDLQDLLRGVRRVLTRWGSLRACFVEGLKTDDPTMLPALSGLVAALREGSRRPKNYLLPSPSLGSACKRLNLFLRWMVRKDDVDPGVWAPLPQSKLVVPLDAHMHRIGLRMGFTRRQQGNLRTALEVTEGFRRLCPEDPVRYDFVLTHLSMRKDSRLERFLGD